MFPYVIDFFQTLKFLEKFKDTLVKAKDHEEEEVESNNVNDEDEDGSDAW